MKRIKYALAKLAAKITGRKCSLCAHNRDGRCCHYFHRMYADCWLSITRPGFTPRYHLATLLTDQEQHQLQKIKVTLDDAAEMARESGLLTED